MKLRGEIVAEELKKVSVKMMTGCLANTLIAKPHNRGIDNFNDILLFSTTDLESTFDVSRMFSSIDLAKHSSYVIMENDIRYLPEGTKEEHLFSSFKIKDINSIGLRYNVLVSGAMAKTIQGYYDYVSTTFKELIDPRAGKQSTYLPVPLYLYPHNKINDVFNPELVKVIKTADMLHIKNEKGAKYVIFNRYEEDPTMLTNSNTMWVDIGSVLDFTKEKESTVVSKEECLESQEGIKKKEEGQKC